MIANKLIAFYEILMDSSCRLYRRRGICIIKEMRSRNSEAIDC